MKIIRKDKARLYKLNNKLLVQIRIAFLIITTQNQPVAIPSLFVITIPLNPIILYNI
jgi:hypothetical protein